jgi:hypothetical protein
MKVAFLGHTQEANELRPSRGYVTREEADRLERELVVERISRKKIRALSPDSIFLRRLDSTESARLSAHLDNRMPFVELPGLRFRLERSRAGRDLIGLYHPAIKAFQEAAAL